MCMNDPFKSSDNQQTSASGTSHTDSAGLPTVKVRKRRMGSWLFFALLILLVAALTVRDDLRQKAVERSESVVRYLALDLLGVSPRDVFVWRLRVAGLLDTEMILGISLIIIICSSVIWYVSMEILSPIDSSVSIPTEKIE